MITRLGQIFNGYSLIAINAGIMLLALFAGGGTYFFDTGLIHIIALLFVALAISRVFLHYYTYDPILEKFVHANLFAMAVFALSHIFEFFSVVILHQYTDAAFANVANIYLISLFIMIIGAGPFVGFRHPLYTRVLRVFSFGAIIVLSTLTALFLSSGHLVSLDTHAIAPYVYVIVLVASVAIALAEVHKIKTLAPVARSFANYLVAAIVLSALAALMSVVYEFLEDYAGTPEYLTVYLSHFAFYGALSIFFLAFGRLEHLGGVFTDIQNHGSR